tara:strand:- start:1007 stop:1141 length:135 start_codon:yes stop_codon:yes gene_type:complete
LKEIDILSGDKGKECMNALRKRNEQKQRCKSSSEHVISRLGMIY